MSEQPGLSPAKRALLERALAARRARTAAAAGEGAIPRRSGDGPAPLSFAQQRMWFLQQWEPGSPTFNGARAVRLRGELDHGALQAALARVMQRHESLRTVVRGHPEPRQHVLDEYVFTVGVAETTEAALPERLRALAREPFDLSADLMLRADVLRVAPREHVLLLRMHHIAADAWSDRVLFGELAELYEALLRGRAPQLPELPIQYGDYAVWQRERISGERLAELQRWWARQLEGAPELLRLPTDRPRPAVQRHAGAHHEIELDRRLAEQLSDLGRAHGATFFMTMLAAFATLLYRFSGEEDVVIGSPIAGRANAELEDLIGFFTNTIVLRARLAGNPSFRDVVTRAKEAALGAYAHQELPFEKVVEAVSPRRDASFNPLFQVNFRAQADARPALTLSGLESEPVSVDIGFSRFDLALELELRADALGGYIEFDEDLFDAATAVRLEEDLRALLEQAAASPDRPVLELALPHGARRSRPGATAAIRGRRRA